MRVTKYSFISISGLVACANANIEVRDDLAGILSDPAGACSQLGSSLSIDNVTVNFASYLPAGTNISLSQDFDLASCGFTSQVITADMCRLAMYVSTSNRSGITLEAWLPTNWTGRFLSTGNGGVSGCIQYADLAYTAGLGFATVGANNGHNGTSGRAFGNNTDVVHDFADRSLHTGVVVGKQITEKYYGTAHKKSYYLGCSTGGRQGFKSVQTYPEDFDGVVAGAPALNFPNLNSWSASFFTYFGSPGNPAYVPRPLWTLIHQEILNQCDGIDGVVDGIIEDAELCRFRPEALQCPSNATVNSTTCLTSPQVDAVRKTFTDFYGVNGELIYPRMNPGSEVVASNVYYLNGAMPYPTDWFKYVVLNDSTWDPATFTIQDAEFSNNQNPFDIKTWHGDISAFQKAGGKLLHYHGQMDAIITSENSPVYYNLVSRTMGLNSSELDDFYRFFRVGGMGHCSGGDGAHMLGQRLGEITTLDPQNNILMRMVDWVEKGNAPETITGTKYVNNTQALGVDLVRNHCKYPKRNFCVDPANYKKAEAWKCI
ncbi:putative ferulic acid Esterase/Feruloyl esterase [Cadophora sp. MPI-SDFR-AT-0126]|nr:putative ferulic acid Esterase/Feruloyl esterase [Leotiomycetes sp. MPI-SDFR-AT-0126]